MRALEWLNYRKTHKYQAVSEDLASGIQTSHNSQRGPPTERAFYHGTALPWTICGILLIALVTLALQKRPAIGSENLGSYEEGFTTDIEPARAAIALKKTRFYGGVQIDGKGKYSLSVKPNATNFFAPPSPEVDDAWSKEMLIEGTYGFVGLTAEEISDSGLVLLDEDLIDGKYIIQPSSIHALHCLNTIRKSLARDYYTDIEDGPAKPYRISHRMHLDHCLENIRQHLICHFDLTWTPRRWRPEAKVVHADTDQWHVCRDFEGMQKWLSTRI